MYIAWLRRRAESDPISLTSDASAYAYVGGNPLSASDPNGKGALGQAIGGYIGGWGAGLLGVETGPFDALLIAGGRYAGAALGSYIEDVIVQANAFPPGVWPGDKGLAEWGRQNGIGVRDAKGRFHGVKQGCGAGGRDNFGVDPATGDVYDPAGDIVGNLDQVKPK